MNYKVKIHFRGGVSHLFITDNRKELHEKLEELGKNDMIKFECSIFKD